VAQGSGGGIGKRKREGIWKKLQKERKNILLMSRSTNTLGSTLEEKKPNWRGGGGGWGGGGGGGGGGGEGGQKEPGRGKVSMKKGKVPKK